VSSAQPGAGIPGRCTPLSPLKSGDCGTRLRRPAISHLASTAEPSRPLTTHQFDNASAAPESIAGAGKARRQGGARLDGDDPAGPQKIRSSGTRVTGVHPEASAASAEAKPLCRSAKAGVHSVPKARCQNWRGSRQPQLIQGRLPLQAPLAFDRPGTGGLRPGSSLLRIESHTSDTDSAETSPEPTSPARPHPVTANGETAAKVNGQAPLELALTRANSPRPRKVWISRRSPPSSSFWRR